MNDLLLVQKQIFVDASSDGTKYSVHAKIGDAFLGAHHERISNNIIIIIIIMIMINIVKRMYVNKPAITNQNEKSKLY